MNTGWNFKRGLDGAFIDALPELAKAESWFDHVLKDHELFIGIRDNYFNVYSKGQSLFKASWSPRARTISVTTHVKYLVDPQLDEQISLSGGEFDIAGVKPLAGRYEGAATLRRMKKAAAYYSGDEKVGLHAIVMKNPQIIDLEVALSKEAEKEVGEDDEKPRRATAPRIDAACLEEIEGKIHLCFWEAKDYENAALWSTTAPPVVAQVETYRTLVQKYKVYMLQSYRRVAQNLLAIAKLAAREKQICPLIVDVANGRDLFIDEPPHVGVIVFGYSRADAESERHKSMRHKMEVAKLALATKGNADGFHLRSAKYQ